MPQTSNKSLYEQSWKHIYYQANIEWHSDHVEAGEDCEFPDAER